MAREQFLTMTRAYVLILLALTEECCGVDIMERSEIFRGRVTVGPGTLYAMLSKFEATGIIRRTAEEGRKKSYIITSHGKKMLSEEYDRLKRMIQDGDAVRSGL